MGKRTPDTATETERYLQQLADGLDALAPADRTEVLAEIRSHIADATAESGGDEALALAGFDGPDLLATRILQERGLITEVQGLPSAPGWMRWAAVIMDATRWLLLLWVLISAVLLFPFDGGRSTLVFALAWAWVAAVLALTVWWWVRKRRQRGHITTGMNIMGLRRVRVGGNTRLVLATDLGESRRGKGELVAAGLWALMLLLVLGVFAFGLVNWARSNAETNRQQNVQQAARDVLDAERAVTGVYTAALEGTLAGDSFSPEAVSGAAELVARHASGAFDSYDIVDVQLPGYKPMPSDDSLAGYTVEALVDVVEFHRDGGVQATYEYRVVKHITDLRTDENTVGFSWRWLIESVGRTEG